MNKIIYVSAGAAVLAAAAFGAVAIATQPGEPPTRLVGVAPAKTIAPSDAVAIVPTTPTHLVQEPEQFPPALPLDQQETPVEQSIPEVETPVEQSTQPEMEPDGFAEWLENPTFTCDDGFAPGWLNERGMPTGCVAN